MLVGRSEEQQILADVLSSLRAGRSAVTVVTGEPGIGKTVLLDWLVEAAGDEPVIRTTGVPQEVNFSFGGLHQILTPLLPHIGSLPSPQRQALQVALALETGPPPDRFLVYLSALTLITAAALHRPLLFVVDDFQWLDQQSREALAFAARRVLADPVAFVFGLRPESVGLELDGAARPRRARALSGIRARAAARHRLGTPASRLRHGTPDRRGGRGQPAGH